MLEEFSDSSTELETVRVEHFELAVLGRGVALLTDTSVHKAPNGELYRHTHRSSLWVETETGWQMSFHQGTEADVSLLPGKRQP